MSRIEIIWGKLEDVVMAIFSLNGLGLIFFEIVARYFVPSILPDWGAEVIVYLMITAILIAGSPLVMSDRHIRADLFIRRLPLKLQYLVEAANLFAGLVYCAIIAKFGIDVVSFAQMLDVRSYSTLQFPLWIFYIALPLSFSLMSLRYLIRIHRFFFKFNETMLPGNESEYERAMREGS